MKYAVLADIHSNLEALEVVLQDTRDQKCTHYCCVGDVVGYGANPKECLDIIRSQGMPCVKGNHDEYCSSEEDLEGFNPHAAVAVNWTRTQLTKDDRQWLRELKYVRLVASFSMAGDLNLAKRVLKITSVSRAELLSSKTASLLMTFGRRTLISSSAYAL